MQNTKELLSTLDKESKLIRELCKELILIVTPKEEPEEQVIFRQTISFYD